MRSSPMFRSTDRAVTPINAASSGMVMVLLSRHAVNIFPDVLLLFTDTLPTISRLFTDVLSVSTDAFADESAASASVPTGFRCAYLNVES